jgi:DNA-directed RNA polymerase beta' subunit
MVVATPKRIKQIKFGLISPKEFRKMSVTRVITADTYDDDGFPIEMGLMDTKLGVIDPGLRACSTGDPCRLCKAYTQNPESNLQEMRGTVARTAPEEKISGADKNSEENGTIDRGYCQ